jgi:molybdenum cofactor biosynthesis enzyme MoaA
LFLFVTSRCNLVCRTCFYFDKLNSLDDLTADEIGRISETAPPLVERDAGRPGVLCLAG